jgi:diamine N-acetyltransferase
MTSANQEYDRPIIHLRQTTEADLDFVLDAEQSVENSQFITVWNRERHQHAANSDDERHYIIESEDGDRVGYALLAGLTNPNQSIEFRRMVITDKGKGYGREALRAIKQLAFDELNAHRLWLDVKDHNLRARSLYHSEGFVVEGTLRECIKTDTGYESLVIMSILKDERPAKQ